MSLGQWMRSEWKLLTACVLFPFVVLGGLALYGMAKGRDE